MRTFDINQPFKTKYGRAPNGVYCIAAFYTNGQRALQIKDINTHEPLLTASVALDETQTKDEIFIKDWSENEGVLTELIRHNVVKNPHGYIPTGFVEAQRCYLTEEYAKYWNEQPE